ncbi:hypothetical protein ACFY3U_15140 [Micromonospora sp. NPDC000089]|uniref:hypothetical protein n=1 Tax=unclassified Micromonospora TaxID=2617518 RepID=UPI003673C79B
MRGGLDESLARLARREEALRRRAAEPGDEPRRDTQATGRPDGPVRRPPSTAPPTDRREAGDRDPVAEVAEAVRQVVAAHPGLTVIVRVEHGGRTHPLRIARDGEQVAVGPDNPGTPPPAWPLSTRTVPSWAGPEGLSGDPATRLAELIRRDPSLLDADG